ncbi:MAG: hypothetical protein IMX01_07660 [Limnochordaceae bacterium]|nr:hypothetical protein [Limnochordaceae bacterium]
MIDSQVLAAQARQHLQNRSVQPAQLHVLAGFDGFVDEICDVVDKRLDVDHYVRFETIAAYAERVAQAAGLSANIELVPRTIKLGGNGPIMANSLVSYGFSLTYIGSVGVPSPHPVFQELAQRAKVIGIADPGHTDALEFSDGKLMMGKLEPIKHVSWDNLMQHVPREELSRLFQQSALVALVDWSILPRMTEIWQHLTQEFLPTLSLPRDLFFFIDLADPRKRTVEELQEALHLIQAFRPFGRVIAGFNRNEADQVAAALGVTPHSGVRLPLDELTERIGRALDLWATVVHPTEEAAAYAQGKTVRISGPYTPNPKLTTGAGDNFNAGLCTGLLLGLPLAEALLVGTATSGFYVRFGHSPSLDQLIDFLGIWTQQGVEALDQVAAAARA